MHQKAHRPEKPKAPKDSGSGAQDKGNPLHAPKWMAPEAREALLQSMSAPLQAYTQGGDIHFAPGKYEPETKKGQELLGHELAHVGQQRKGKVKPMPRLADIKPEQKSKETQAKERQRAEMWGLRSKSPEEQMQLKLKYGHDQVKSQIACTRYQNFVSSNIAQLKRNRQDTRLFRSKAKQFGRVVAQRKIDYGSEEYIQLAAEYFPGQDLSVEMPGQQAIPVNDSPALEKEADVMGEKAAAGRAVNPSLADNTAQIRRKEESDKIESYKEVGIVQTDVKLRETPDTNTTELKLLKRNTAVYIFEKLDTGWYKVITEYGDEGYVASDYIWTNLPEPSAKLHRIQKKQTPTDLVNIYYKDYLDPEHGRDVGYYVHVLYFANTQGDVTKRERQGESITAEGAENVLPMNIWKKTQLQENSDIWIPSPLYAYFFNFLTGSNARAGSGWFNIWDITLFGRLKKNQPVFDLLYNNKDKINKSVQVCRELYLLDAIKKYSVETPLGFLYGMLDFLKTAALVVGVSTALGAIGGLFSGAGTVKGGFFGFKLGCYIVNVLGVGFILGFVSEAFNHLDKTFDQYLLKIATAKTEKDIDEAAKFLADGIGQIAGLIVAALILYLLRKGGKAAIKGFKTSTLGQNLTKRMGEAELTKWLEEKLSKEEKKQETLSEETKEIDAESYEELCKDPQTHKKNPKSIIEADAILQAKSEGLVENPQRPDLEKGEPNLDFKVDGPEPYKWVDVKTPINKGDLTKMALDIGKKTMIQKGGSNDVLHIIDLKNIPEGEKLSFKNNVVKGAGSSNGIDFIND